MKFLKFIIPAFAILFSACAEDIAVIHDIGSLESPESPELPEVEDEELGSHRLLVYVNFDGGELFYGDCGNPQENITCIKQTEGDFPPHDSDDEYRSDVINLLRSLWEEYDVAFTRLRPDDHYDYVMIVVSPQQYFNDERLSNGLGAIGGVAPVDCDNKRLSDTAHVFTGRRIRDELDMAEIISHEVGHTIGLGHVDPPDSIMFGNRSTKDREWRDECIEVTESFCIPLVPDACPDGYINFHQELLSIIGPSFQ